MKFARVGRGCRGAWPLPFEPALLPSLPLLVGVRLRARCPVSVAGPARDFARRSCSGRYGCER